MTKVEQAENIASELLSIGRRIKKDTNLASDNQILYRTLGVEQELERIIERVREMHRDTDQTEPIHSTQVYTPQQQ